MGYDITKSVANFEVKFLRNGWTKTPLFWRGRGGMHFLPDASKFSSGRKIIFIKEKINFHQEENKFLSRSNFIFMRSNFIYIREALSVSPKGGGFCPVGN